MQIADTICGQNELGFYLTSNSQDVSDEMLEYIGLGENSVGEVLEMLPERIQETEQVFGE